MLSFLVLFAHLSDHTCSSSRAIYWSFVFQVWQRRSVYHAEHVCVYLVPLSILRSLVSRRQEKETIAVPDTTQIYRTHIRICIAYPNAYLQK